MNTGKSSLPASCRIDTATRLVRVYKHRFCYAIIDNLLVHGEMTLPEIASRLELPESYIRTQLDKLLQSELVLQESAAGGLWFSANEVKLLHLKKAIGSFSESWAC